MKKKTITKKQRAAVFVKLKAAWCGLIDAAVELEGVYGKDDEHAKQLRGAAKMIVDDWMPAIQKESERDKK